MADFQFYLNRQGVRGAKGVKGDKGDPPIVSVNKHTANEYVLQIDNPDGTQIITPNLVGQQIVVNTAGDYVKYDRDSNQFVTVELPSATGEEEGLIRLATDADYAERDEFSAVTPYGLVQHLPSLITTSTDNLIRVLYDETKDSIVLDTSKISEDINGVNTTATEALTASQNNTNEINALKSTATNIDDTTTSTDKVWSSSKTNSEISIVANNLVQTQGDVATLDANMTEIKPIVQANTKSISSINYSISQLNKEITNTLTLKYTDPYRALGSNGGIYKENNMIKSASLGFNTMDAISIETHVLLKGYFDAGVEREAENWVPDPVTDATRYLNAAASPVFRTRDHSDYTYYTTGDGTSHFYCNCEGDPHHADIYGVYVKSVKFFGSKEPRRLYGSNDATNWTEITQFPTTQRYFYFKVEVDYFDKDGSRVPHRLGVEIECLRNEEETASTNTNRQLTPLVDNSTLIKNNGKLSVSQALLDRIAALEATVASLQTQIGEISAKLDAINGEEI